MLAVDQAEQSWLVRSAPTLTALRPAAASQLRAVLLMMPGGDGQIGLRPDAALDTTPPRRSFAAIPRRLVDPQRTSGAVHVVAVDSPYALGHGPGISLRAIRDHLVRMESVAQFHRERFGPRRVTLRDGRKVILRPIVEADAEPVPGDVTLLRVQRAR